MGLRRRPWWLYFLCGFWIVWILDGFWIHKWREEKIWQSGENGGKKRYEWREVDLAKMAGRWQSINTGKTDGPTDCHYHYRHRIPIQREVEIKEALERDRDSKYVL